MYQWEYEAVQLSGSKDEEMIPLLDVVVKGKCQGLMFSDFVSSYSLGD